jgi:FKBP-type peptidyl-prolyl cis-trans isomerase
MKNIPAYVIVALLLLSGVAPALLGCKKDDLTSTNETLLKRQEKYKAIDDSIIRAYLVRNKFEPGSYIKTKEGIYIVTLTSNPQGRVAEMGKLVSLKYEGRLISKQQENFIFDTTYNGRSLCECFQFVVGDRSLIQGWGLGLPLMRQGDHKLLILPSYLAYGPSGGAIIPPDAPLLFDMVIVSVSQ